MRTIGNRSFYDKLEETIEPSRVAVLVIDQQNDFCDDGGFYAKDMNLDISMLQAITDPINRLTAAAREKGVPVIFTQNVIKKHFVSDSSMWLGIHVAAGLKSLDQERFYMIEGTWGAELYQGLVVDPSDIVIPKLRSSSFHNTPLDALLRAHGVETIIITGQVTEGCVENTIRSARDHDYFTVLAKDAIGSTSRERHDRIMMNWLTRSHCPDVSDIANIWAELR